MPDPREFSSDEILDSYRELNEIDWSREDESPYKEENNFYYSRGEIDEIDLENGDYD